MRFLSSKSQLNFHVSHSRLCYERSLPLPFIWLSHHSVLSPYSSISDSAFSSFHGGGFPLYFLAVVLISENTYYLRNLRQLISWDISPHLFEKPLMQLQTAEWVFQCGSAITCAPQPASRIPPTPLNCSLNRSSAKLSVMPKNCSFSKPNFPAVLWWDVGLLGIAPFERLVFTSLLITVVFPEQGHSEPTLTWHWKIQCNFYQTSSSLCFLIISQWPKLSNSPWREKKNTCISIQ